MKKYCKPTADITKLEPLHILSVSLDDEYSPDPPATKGSEWAEEDFDSNLGFDW